MKPPFNEVPSYWWDMEDHNGKPHIIVESNDDRFPVVGRFQYDPDSKDAAEPAIKDADKLIEDLKAGRVDPRKLYKELTK